MIDKETGKEMDKVYVLENVVECKECDFCDKWDYCKYDARCNVTFHERFTDDNQHFLHLEFHFNSIWGDEINFKELQRIVSNASLWERNLNVIRKTLNGNWEVKLDDDTSFSCHHEIEDKDNYYWCSDHSNTVNLGKIAECYKDCSLCNNCEECVKINGRDDLLKALRRDGQND